MPARVTVIGLGCELDRLFEGQRPALPVPGPPDREDLRDLFETLGAPLRSGEAVIVVVGDWLPPETLSRVRTVHSLLETDRVAIHVTHLPPLAASVLAAMTAAVAPFARSAGALAGALEAIGDELVVLAWAGSVAGLRHPEVSLLHHARSALPWSSFGIGVQPESFVQPITRAGRRAPADAAASPDRAADRARRERRARVDRPLAWRPPSATRRSGSCPGRCTVPSGGAPRAWWRRSAYRPARSGWRRRRCPASCFLRVVPGGDRRLAVPVLRRRRSGRDPRVGADAARLTRSTERRPRRRR